jgi:MFS family permease
MAFMINRNFRWYFAGATLSAVGSAMTTVALTFAVLDAGLPATALGIVLAAQTVPTVLFLLAGGVVGDRWPRRRVMIGADLLRCCVQSALAVLLIAGFPSLAALVSLTALIGVGNAFFGPASRGWLPGIVDTADLGRANGALMTGNAMAMIAGPSIAGLIVAGVGPGWALGLDGLSYAASAICLGLVRVSPELQPVPAMVTRPMIGDLREGFAAFAQRRWLWMIVAQSGLMNMLAIALFRIVAPALLAARPDGAQAWGFLLGAVGAGALAGALVTMRWQPPRPLVAIEMAIFMLVAPLLLLAANAPFPSVLAGSLALGFGYAAVNVLMVSAIQREVPKALLSRVMSFVQLADMGLAPIGYILAGPAAALLGPRGALAVSATCVLLSVAGALCLPEIRRLGTDSLEPGKPNPIPMAR